MNMNRYIYTLMAAVALLLGITACNEKLSMFEANQNPPEVTDFSPKNGVAGTEISITGANLQEVDSIKIGGVKTDVKYRINRSLVIAGVTNEVVSGIIEVFTPYGSIKTSESFTMEYVIPELTGYVNKSRPYTVVGLTGENLDIVTGVLFGTKEATVVTQTREEIEVEVPYFKDEAVDIVLNYQYGTEIRQVSTSGTPFSLELAYPSVSDYPRMTSAGSSIEIKGVNLTQVDSVFVGEYKAEITKRATDVLTCQLSAEYEVTGTKKITFYYYDETKLETAEDCQVIVPEVYIWKNITLYGHGSENANLFSGTTGKYYNPCEFADNKEIIHLCATQNSDGMQLAGFSKKLNIHKFKCNGKALEADGLNLRFRKLLETTPAEKAYMDKIKNGTLEKISIEQAKADGLNLTGSTKQVARYKLLDDNYNKTNLEGFDIGGINLLLVYSDVDGKNLVAIGFVELVAVQMESVSDTKGSMTLNFYFQKD